MWLPISVLKASLRAVFPYHQHTIRHLLNVSRISPSTFMSGSVEQLASPFKHLLKDPATTARTFRCLLRDLLRETTYLPDPWLRTYYRSHIIQRYRAYLGESDRPTDSAAFFEDAETYLERSGSDRRAQQKARKSLSLRKPDKQYTMFIHARHELRSLVRANIGHERPLFRIMSRAYGRSGPRRYSLLRDTWQTDVPADSKELKKLLQQRLGLTFEDNGENGANVLQHVGFPGQEEGYILGQVPWEKNTKNLPEDRKPKPMIPELPSRIVALVKAQLATGMTDTNKTVLTTKPAIPATNIWGRPTPVVRQRNIIAEWILELKRGLLPPLPRAEFLRLRKLADGDFEGLVTPLLPGEMPPLVKVREYGSPLSHPQRRPLGTVRKDTIGVQANQSSHSDLNKYLLDAESPDPDIEDLEAAIEEEHGESLLPLNPQTVERNMVATRDAHFLTTKFLRRMYARLLDLTCEMREIDGKHVVEWGRADPEWKSLYAMSENVRKRPKPRRTKSTTNTERGDSSPGVAKQADKTSPRPVAKDAWMFGADDPMEKDL